MRTHPLSSPFGFLLTSISACIGAFRLLAQHLALYLLALSELVVPTWRSVFRIRFLYGKRNNRWLPFGVLGVAVPLLSGCPLKDVGAQGGSIAGKVSKPQLVAYCAGSDARRAEIAEGFKAELADTGISVTVGCP